MDFLQARHLPYWLVQDTSKKPSISLMLVRVIELLSRVSQVRTVHRTPRLGVDLEIVWT